MKSTFAKCSSAFLSLLGRYDEARSELERAQAIRPDFCASYEHLAGIAVFEAKPEEIAPLVARATQNCPLEVKSALDCEGRPKLFIQLNLALALDRSGAPQEAEAVLTSVRTVNPAFARVYPLVAERTPGGARR